MGWPLLPDPAHTLLYRTAAPLATHWRKATCEEAECPAYAHGWLTVVPDPGPQADWIRAASGRRFAEERQAGGLVQFTFEPGQACFAAADHVVPLGRPPLYVVREGNVRVSRPLRAHTNGQSWVDDLRTHTEKIARQRNG